jgi:capsular exopolysaccharide synthesis family protein
MPETHDPLDQQAFEGDQPRSSFNPFRLMWRHRYLILLGVVAGSVIGALYYVRATPIYQSSAQVLVVKKTPDALPLAAGSEGRANQTEDYLSTHQTLIRSPVIVGDAIRKGELGRLPSFAGRGDAMTEIAASLKVSRETNGSSPTSVLNISFRGSGADDCAAVVQAVVASYQQFLSARYKSVTDEAASLITQANEILEKKLTHKQQEYDRFILEHPALWKGKDGVSALQERILVLDAKRCALELQEAEIQGRLDAFEKALKDGRLSRAEVLAMISQMPARVGSDGTVLASALEERIAALELQLKILQEDYGPEHPQVRSVRNQLGLLRAQTGRLGKDSAVEESGRLDPVRTHLQALKLELENTRMAAGAVGKLLQEEQKKAESQRGFEKQDEAYRMEIARSQHLFDAIAKRLDEVSILKDFAGGFEAEVISPPRVGAKVYPTALTAFGCATVLGLLVGFGLAYLAELSDQSFRTPEEIRRRLGLQVVGHIPYFGEAAEEELPADGPGLEPSLRAVYHPKSREAEAYRGVRTALYFATKDARHAVIQVTSPDMGDGKTTLVANLAVSVAQSGKKVILIDADFRRPRLHKMFNLSAKQGLASVIVGDAQLEQAIQPTAVAGLFVVPCGPIPPNPAELLTLPRFRELLTLIREQFDFVLVDTPPLLAVTDPCVVVPHMDAVILTVRISKKARPHAARAKEILSTLGARVLGVVVNGVGTDDRDYGYDGYRYGYTYKYYNYANSYYQEDTAHSSETNGHAGTQAGGNTKPPRKRPGSRRSKRKRGFLSRMFGL